MWREAGLATKLEGTEAYFALLIIKARRLIKLKLNCRKNIKNEIEKGKK